MAWSFVHLSYYLMWLMLAAWLGTLFLLAKMHGPAIKASLGLVVGGLLASGLLITGIFLTVPAGLKIFNDDVRLLSVSKSLYEEARADSVRSAVRIDGKTEVFRRSFEKRPLLFPFLTHLVHRVKGYTVKAPLAVNFIFSWGILFLVFFVVSRACSDPIMGFAGMLAVIAHPVFSISATGGGMEIVNLFFLALSFAFLHLYLKNPTKECFHALLLTLVVGAHARYESGLFLALTLTALAARRHLSWKTVRQSWAWFAASAIFLQPVLWQRWIKAGSQEPSSVEKAFDVSWIPKNTLNYFECLGRGDIGVNNVIDGLGIVACLYFVVRFFINRRRTDNAAKSFATAIFLNLVALWFLITAYYSGSVDGRFSARFFMIHGVFFSIMSVFFLDHILKKIPFKGWLVLGATAALVFMYHPSAVANVGVRESYYRRDYDSVNAWLRKRPAGRIIYVYPFPEYLLVNGYSSVDFKTANKKWNYLEGLVRDGRFEAIYVIHDRNIFTQEIPKKLELTRVQKERMEQVDTFEKGQTSSYYVYKVINPQ